MANGAVSFSYLEPVGQDQGENTSGGEVVGQSVGYARVSTVDQRLDRQIDQLTAAGVVKLFTDKVTGSTRQRPGLEEALRYVRSGDEFVVVSMDRLARSLRDLYDLVDDLVARGVAVRFLHEGQVYSSHSTPIAKLMLGLLGSVAEFERSIIRERQTEGIARAKARGVYQGRAKVLTGDEVDRARDLVARGVPKATVARQLGIGRSTLYRYLNSKE